MKRHLFSAVASAVLLAAFVPAQATDVASSFDVSVSLTAICTASNSGATTLDFGTYTAFGAATTPNPTVDLTFSCTRGLAAPTFVFDNTDAARAAAGAAGYGVLAGLNYSLAAANQATTAGSAATAAAGGVGSADTRTVRVTGTMAAGQAGACANSDAATCAGAAATHARTLTITY